MIKVHQSQQKVTQYFLLWEEDLGQSLILKKNQELLTKISLQLEDLDSSVAGSYVRMNSQPETISPEQSRTCRFQTDIPMSLSNFPIGKVTVCFRTSVLVLESLFSPIFLFTLLLTFLFSTLAFHREGKKENALYLANQIANLSRQVAHDVRGPLMALKALSTQSHELSQDKAQLLVSAINRIHSIADDLLRKSKTSKQGAEPRAKSIFKIHFSVLQRDLTELMTELKVRFPQATVNFHCTAAEPLMVDLSTVEIQRIVSNLVQNAVEAKNSTSDSEVNLTLHAKSGFAYLDIMDNGSGMTETQLAEALDGKSFGKTDGNGLGLSHALKVVRDHGGELSCNSKLGLGTQISIKLPLAATAHPDSLIDHKS